MAKKVCRVFGFKGLDKRHKVITGSHGMQDRAFNLEGISYFFSQFKTFGANIVGITCM